jgi:hypothetical protein
MRRGSRRTKAALVALVVGIAGIALLVNAAVAPAGGNKNYTATVSPTSAPFGVPTKLTVTLANCGPVDPAPCSPSTQYLGSANVTFPAAFTGLSVVTPTPVTSAGNPWTASFAGNALQLRNSGSNTTYALAPGSSVQVQVWATVSACGGPFALSSIAKQSNDFSGQPGNNFSLAGPAPSVSVAPGTTVDHFDWTQQPGANQTAGIGFGAQVTAKDACGNVVTSYVPGAFSVKLAPPGPHTSPSGKPEDDGSVTWNQGVGTITGVTDFKAETTNLVAADGAAHAPSSNTFTVAPGLLQNLAFSAQPSETAQGSSISPAPAVTATDTWGNPISGALVTVSLSTIAGTGVLTGVVGVQTGQSGVASFPQLAVTSAGEYKLQASSGSANATSAPFVVASQISPCHGSCNASGSVNNNTTTNASASNASGSLAVSVLLGLTPPLDPNTGLSVCGPNPPLGAGSIVQILQAGGSQPDFTVTWTLDKSIVQQVPNNGASQFNICLGAENLNDPSGANTTGWTTKSGSAAVAVADPNLGVTLFWGILPDCPKNPTSPCVLAKNKDKAGDEVIKFFKPHPWDGVHFGQ